MNHAVESVLTQPYQQIEIVLVDDGSTDESAALCDTLSKENQRIHVLHQKNGGVSAARNAGIEYVLNSLCRELENGYIAFLDADDAWTPDFFSDDIVDKLQCGYELIGYRSYWCNEDLTRGRREIPAFPAGEYEGNEIREVAYLENFWAMLYSFPLLQKYACRFRINLHYGEDYLFKGQNLYLSNSLLLVDKTLYLYRCNISSVIHRRPHGISYYAPIFQANADSDAFLNQQESINRKENSNMGKWYIGWSIPSMIEDHFRGGGSRREIETWLSENKKYIDFMYKYGGENTVRRYEHITQHMMLIEIKCKLYRIASWVFNRAKRMKPIKRVYERKNYPILLE